MNFKIGDLVIHKNRWLYIFLGFKRENTVDSSIKVYSAYSVEDATIEELSDYMLEDMETLHAISDTK